MTYKPSIVSTPEREAYRERHRRGHHAHDSGGQRHRDEPPPAPWANPALMSRARLSRAADGAWSRIVTMELAR